MVNLALVQMHCEKGEVSRNLNHIDAYVRAADERGTDIICFPEMSITGYIDPARWPDAVVCLDGPAVARFAAITKGREITAIAGLVEARSGTKPFITQIAVSDGAIRGVYRKRTIPEDESPHFSAGTLPAVVTDRRLRFGLAICADIDSPDVFAGCARQGARVVFEAAAPGLWGSQLTRDWQAGFAWWRDECATKLGQYARDHGLYIAVATQAGRTRDEDFPGGGYLFGPDGSCIDATPDWSEGVLYTAIPNKSDAR